MDIRMYFQKIRQAEKAIHDLWVVVVSLETQEGGKAGVATEVSRASAAQMIVENKVRLAENDERERYYKEANAARVAAQEAAMAQKIQFTVVPDPVQRPTKRSEKE